MPMANSVSWYGHVLKWDDSHVLKKALKFEVEGQRKSVIKMWKKRDWFEQGQCALLTKEGCWCYSDCH